MHNSTASQFPAPFIPPLSRHITSQTMHTAWTHSRDPVVRRSDRNDGYKGEQQHGRASAHGPHDESVHNADDMRVRVNTRLTASTHIRMSDPLFSPLP